MKNFISVNLVTYNKNHLQIINKHNIDRLNFDKPIPYLAKQGEELDKNVNLTFSNFEELENKRQNYLKSKNKRALCPFIFASILHHFYFCRG